MREMKEITEFERTSCGVEIEKMSEYDEWLVNNQQKLFPPLPFVVQEIFPRVVKALYSSKCDTVTLHKKELENILYLATLYANKMRKK
jgi:hypothetical protein